MFVWKGFDPMLKHIKRVAGEGMGCALRSTVLGRLGCNCV